MKVTIEKFDHLGNGIARSDGVIFVKRALPNEVLDVEIISKNKNFAKAEIKEIIDKSDMRIEAVCPYYKDCGGCDFLHAKKVCENQFKIAKAQELFNINPKLYETSEYHYRNKVTLHVQNNKIGFYKSGSNELIQVSYCYLLDDKINEILKRLSEYLDENKVLFDEVMIRVSSDESMLYLNKFDTKIKDSFDFVDTIIAFDKVLKGRGCIYEQIENYKFKVSPKSFFQVNIKGLAQIYNILENNLKLHYHHALDLYGGTGVMGILLSKYASKVTSIEECQAATLDGKDNKKLNNISNIEFINAKVEDYIDKLQDVDLVLVDPPRRGLDNKTITCLLDLMPQSIIYVSCNMITLKRDLESLKEKYEINDLMLVDMFPKTAHVECVSILHRKNLEK